MFINTKQWSFSPNLFFCETGSSHVPQLANYVCDEREKEFYNLGDGTSHQCMSKFQKHFFYGIWLLTVTELAYIYMCALYICTLSFSS